jgi:hypothetical protein
VTQSPIANPSESGSIQFRFQYSFADILELNRTLRSKKANGLLVALMGVAFVLWGLWWLIFGGNQPDATPVLISGGVFIAIGAAAGHFAALGGWWKTAREPVVLHISTQGLEIVAPSSMQYKCEWECFGRWYESRSLLILMPPVSKLLEVLLQIGPVIEIPKRGCDPSELPRVLALVRSKLGTPNS